MFQGFLHYEILAPKAKRNVSVSTILTPSNSQTQVKQTRDDPEDSYYTQLTDAKQTVKSISQYMDNEKNDTKRAKQNNKTHPPKTNLKQGLKSNVVDRHSSMGDEYYAVMLKMDNVRSVSQYQR